MSFSIVAGVARRSQNNARLLRNLALSSPQTLVGAKAWSEQNCVKTRLDGLQQFKQPTTLIIPTLEAGGRALRLVKTAILIVIDYEKEKIFPSDHQQQSSSSDRGENQTMEDLERKREECQQELRKAQIEYTADNDELARRSTQRYTAQKLGQKKAVHDAAAKLAEIEEEMAITGGSELHRRAANRLLQLCRDNGGVYIKIGQHLANLDYLIPPEYIETLSSLFDDAPLTDYSDVCQVIKEDLGKHPDEIFDSFERQPIASASLAQVHVAHEKETGRKLAVKVQHRGLRETSSGDIFALTTVVNILDSLFKDFTWRWISDEIAPQLPKELDFVNEGKNAERAAKGIAQAGVDCVVPKILWDKTSSRVLCMEFEEGFKSTDMKAIQQAGLKKGDIAKLISSVFNSQVFLTAFVHCDPHAANVLIRKKRNGKPQMVLVDHGLYKELDNDFRVRYASLWQSIMLADLPAIKASCEALGVKEMYTLFAAMLTSRPFDEIIERSKTGSLSAKIDPASRSDEAMIRGYAQHFLPDIFSMLGKLPRQMLLLLKMNDCLRHIDFSLGSPANTMIVAGRYATRALYEDQLQKAGRSVLSRFKVWINNFRIVWKIRFHYVQIWWESKTVRSLTGEG